MHIGETSVSSFLTNVIIVATETYFGPSLFLSQAYLKHLKKQQKELNSLKKKHAKVQFVCTYTFWGSFVCLFGFFLLAL